MPSRLIDILNAHSRIAGPVPAPAWWDRAWCATLVYAAAAIAATWPLVTRLGSALPVDLGDSLLNCWILSWGAEHATRLATGDLAAFGEYWNAPIFHPAPLALAYSEHMFAQAVQIAPVYALTQNILLCYNLLFLSTFVLSGLGMYLLVRELTASGLAALAAGAFYGFAMYRLPQFTHLQVLSSQWLPFALYGFRRFFVHRRWRALAVATAALTAQNLSCGYYLLCFPPFVAAYCLAEIAARGAWRDRRVIGGLAASAAVVVLVTAPFLLPYAAIRREGFEPRTAGEVASFSADLLSWLTASPANRVWGKLQVFLKPEGELFPGVVVPALAACALWRRARRRWTSGQGGTARWRHLMTVLVFVALAGVGIFTAVVLITRDANWTIAGVRLHLREPWKAGLLLAALAAALLVISSRTRALVARSSSDPVGWFAVGAILSAWLACGPVIAIGGSPTDLPAPYALLYTHVPGFDGLRVPARIAMLTACCLAVVAGFGFRLLAGDSRRRQAAAASVMALFLLETTGAPIALNARMAAPGYASPPAPVSTGAQAPEVYRFCASLRSTAVILELPFGAPAWELQYVFYQRVHRRPIVNGYSGGFPETYYARKEALTAPDVTPGIAWRALASSSATHVIVHRGAYVADGGERVERWLRGHGAAMIHAAGSDRLYALRAR